MPAASFTAISSREARYSDRRRSSRRPEARQRDTSSNRASGVTVPMVHATGARHLLGSLAWLSVPCDISFPSPRQKSLDPRKSPLTDSPKAFWLRMAFACTSPKSPKDTFTPRVCALFLANADGGDPQDRPGPFRKTPLTPVQLTAQPLQFYSVTPSAVEESCLSRSRSAARSTPRAFLPMVLISPRCLRIPARSSGTISVHRNGRIGSPSPATLRIRLGRRIHAIFTLTI
jgi:hypothetical protein